MNDDWRLRIELDDDNRAGDLTEELRAHRLEGEIGRSVHDRVIVSVDGSEVFCYTDTREQAERVAELVRTLVANHDWEAELLLSHWHPTAERWEDPELPLPDDDAARAAERQERIAQERADSSAHGYPEFEVRIECASRADAHDLAERLRADGTPVVSRWHSVMVGAADEDSANQLAERLRSEAPEGSTVTVEGNLRAIYDDQTWHPFAIFGGLGG